MDGWWPSRVGGWWVEGVMGGGVMVDGGVGLKGCTSVNRWLVSSWVDGVVGVK